MRKRPWSNSSLQESFAQRREKVYSKSNRDDAIVSIYRDNEFFEFFISINT